MSELTGSLEKEEADTPAVFKKKKKAVQPTITGHDVIIPPNSYKEPSNGVFTVLSILLGVVLGAALVWFLIVPSKISSLSYDKQQLVIDYSEQLAANSVDIANLKSQVKSLTTERDNLSKQLSGYTGENGESSMYSLLLEAADAYVNYDFAQALILLQQIDVALLHTQTAKDVYNTMLDSSSAERTDSSRREIKHILKRIIFQQQIILRRLLYMMRLTMRQHIIWDFAGRKLRMRLLRQHIMRSF